MSNFKMIVTVLKSGMRFLHFLFGLRKALFTFLVLLSLLFFFAQRFSVVVSFKKVNFRDKGECLSTLTIKARKTLRNWFTYPKDLSAEFTPA